MKAAATKTLIAKVHIAKKDLALNDDTYRDVLSRVTGRDSCAAMTAGQLEAVLGEMRRLGWKPTKRMRDGRTPVGRLVRALWREASREKSETSLRAMIRRLLELPDNVVVDPDMLTRADATRVIETLKAMKERAAAAGEKSA